MPKLFVICGHGAGDPGAVGNGYSEAERVRVLGKRIKELGGNSVMLGDTNRNYYADNGISSLTISKDYQIIELHMDSASASARGGHVIINSGYEPDNYDKALAAMLKEILPGRSEMIVKRYDLANPRRAAAKGYGYRLVEFGFISNSADVNIFNSRLDDLAKGVLKAFGIGASSNTPSQKPSASTPSNNKLTVDGLWGPNLTKRLQQIFGTAVDGVVSDQFECYRSNNPGLVAGWDWKENPTGSSQLIAEIQKKVGSNPDGHIGPDTIKKIQKWMGTVQDGSLSKPSQCIMKLQEWCNKQK